MFSRWNYDSETEYSDLIFVCEDGHIYFNKFIASKFLYFLRHLSRLTPEESSGCVKMEMPVPKRIMRVIAYYMDRGSLNLQDLDESDVLPLIKLADKLGLPGLLKSLDPHIKLALEFVDTTTLEIIYRYELPHAVARFGVAHPDNMRGFPAEFLIHHKEVYTSDILARFTADNPEQGAEVLVNVLKTRGVPRAGDGIDCVAMYNIMKAMAALPEGAKNVAAEMAVMLTPSEPRKKFFIF